MKIRHGTVWAYEQHKCRCDLCRAAHDATVRAQFRVDRALWDRWGELVGDRYRSARLVAFIEADVEAHADWQPAAVAD